MSLPINDIPLNIKVGEFSCCPILFLKVDGTFVHADVANASIYISV